MRIQIKLSKNIPTLVKLFTKEGVLKYQTEVHNPINDVEMMNLDKGVYTLALQNDCVRFTKRIIVH